MRVLQLIETLRTGGAETSVLAIATETPNTQTVVLPLRGPVEVGSDTADVEIAPPLDARGDRGLLAQVALLQNRIGELEVDLVHSTLFYANVVARLALARSALPLVTTVVGDSYGALRKEGFSPRRLAKLAMVQLADGVTARRSDHFIFISEALRRTHQEALALDPAKCSVIHRGRSLERFTPARTPEDPVPRPPRLASLSPHLICVGRLVESKRTEVAIRALASLRKDHPSAILTIVGDGPRRAFLEGVARTLGITSAVRFLGTRADVPELLSAADIFIFPSAHEGQGGALVEAMATGLPIVASKIPVIMESVCDGDTGLLVPVDDADAVAAACREIWSAPDQGAKMGARARAVAEARFDVKKIGEAHAALYRRLVQEVGR